MYVCIPAQSERSVKNNQDITGIKNLCMYKDVGYSCRCKQSVTTHMSRAVTLYK